MNARNARIPNLKLKFELIEMIEMIEMIELIEMIEMIEINKNTNLKQISSLAFVYT